MAALEKLLVYGTQANYDALATKDSTKLYFITDTKKLYRGSVDFSDNFIVTTEKPGSPIVGKVYFLTASSTVEAYTTSGWKTLTPEIVTSLSASSTDNQLPSAKSVWDAIQDAVEDITSSSDVVKSIATGDANGQIKVTKADNSSANVDVKGVVTVPTWDASARVLTLPISGDTLGEHTVTVNIGKDIFIDPTAENGYNPTTKTIDIYLNDGSKSSDPTKISIPAESLIDEYDKEDTASIALSIDNHKIKAALKLDTVSGNGDNALSVTENGLYLSLGTYATQSYVDTAVGAVQSDLDTLETTVEGHTTTLNTLTADATTAGSIDYKIAQAQTTIESEIQDVASGYGWDEIPAAN